MKFAELTSWVEDHPTESIVIGAGGLIAILWLLGYFGGSSNANAGASNLASAYYAAEAQQAVVGGQIQQATISAAAQTAIAQSQANAAVAIQKSQSGAAVKINGQNASAATTINAQDDATAAAASNNQLLATYSNNSTALQTTLSNNATAATIATTNANASLMSTFMNSLVAPEMATYGSADITVPGLGRIVGNSNMTPNIAALESMGYSNAQALQEVNQVTGWNIQ